MANPDTCSLAGLKPLWQLVNEEKEGHWSWEKWIYPVIEGKDFLKLNHLQWEGMNGIKGTLYPTSHSSTHFLLRPPLTNPLKAAVQESRRQGLKPYAWFEYGMMLNPKNPIAEKHPDWLLKTVEGETVEDGNVWLDPTHPEVQGLHD